MSVAPTQESTAGAIARGRVDDVEFLVLAVSMVDHVEGRANRKETGHWLAIKMRVVNQGKSTVVLNTQGFQVTSGAGKNYLTDDPAMFTDNDSDELIGSGITPGAKAEGTLLFAVPRNAKSFVLTSWKPDSSVPPAKLSLRV